MHMCPVQRLTQKGGLGLWLGLGQINRQGPYGRDNGWEQEMKTEGK